MIESDYIEIFKCRHMHPIEREKWLLDQLEKCGKVYRVWRSDYTWTSITVMFYDVNKKHFHEMRNDEWMAIMMDWDRFEKFTNQYLEALNKAKNG